MNIALVYFSGTGNTRKCILAMEQALADKKQETAVFDLEKEGNIDLSSFDCLLIGYPIHAFNAPKIILDFATGMNSLPKDDPVYILKTSGEGLHLNDYSSARLLSLLRKNGYQPRGEFHYLMPYDMVFRHTEDMAYQMWDTARKLIPLDAQEILDGCKREWEATPFTKAILSLLRIEQKASGIVGKTFHADSKCIRCGLCVRNCPVKNISMDDKGIHFSTKCILCSRCAFFCPEDAIHLGILNFMKVNGPYKFQRIGDGMGKEGILEKSYEDYFKNAEERIQRSEKKEEEKKK